MKQLMTFLGTLLFVSSSMAQSREIRGVITMFNTYPVKNLEVLTKKAKTASKTDDEGSFVLGCNEKDVVQIKAKEFLSVSGKVDYDVDHLSLNIVFKDTPKNRKSVVEKGYISEEDLEYALANLQDENNDYCSYTDIFTLLRNRFPSVEVKTNKNGQPGVYLRRGPKSLLLETQMLYIVNGIRSPDLSSITPCEIAKIEVLTEGRAAIYGAGSSNGAVVVKTK